MTATKQLGGEPYAGWSTREWNPAGPKPSHAQLAMKQARKVRHSKPGRPNPVAEFAATPKAYRFGFRRDNRQNLSESSLGTAKSVGRSQSFPDQPRSKRGSLLAMAAQNLQPIKVTVGARLARDEASTFNNDAGRQAAIAGKPAPTGGCGAGGQSKEKKGDACEGVAF